MLYTVSLAFILQAFVYKVQLDISIFRIRPDEDDGFGKHISFSSVTVLYRTRISYRTYHKRIPIWYIYAHGTNCTRTVWQSILYRNNIKLAVDDEPKVGSISRAHC